MPTLDLKDLAPMWLTSSHEKATYISVVFYLIFGLYAHTTLLCLNILLNTALILYIQYMYIPNKNHIQRRIDVCLDREQDRVHI